MPTKPCPYCGKQIPQETVFCPYCRRNVKPKMNILLAGFLVGAVGYIPLTLRDFFYTTPPDVFAQYGTYGLFLNGLISALFNIFLCSLIGIGVVFAWRRIIK